MVESVHTGHLLAVDASGAAAASRGRPEAEIYARSCLKPLQAVAMLRAGLDVDDAGLALACASHNGEPRHIDVALSLLAGAGLRERDLQNTPGFPLGADARRAWRVAGHPPSCLAQNCSGKHAAMLATCVAAGWPTEDYRDPRHPLQAAIADTLAELTGVVPAHVAVDGCGAPQPSTTVAGLARAFARLVTAPEGCPEARVVRAMTADPWLVGGTGRDVTDAMGAVAGLVAKDGAEGVYAGALADGRAFAVKVSDGASRPRPVVLAAVLRELGEAGDWPWADVPVLGHGERVGSVEPAFGAGARVGSG